MSELYKEIDGYDVWIDYDQEASSPRDWDNLGTIIAYHRNFNLGDKKFDSSQDVIDEINEILEDDPNAFVVGLYMYEHGGVALSTSPFSCPWDSGQVGYVYVTSKKILEEYSQDTMAVRETVSRCVNAEIEEYSEYINGNVFHARITNSDGEEVDSVSGLIGYDHVDSFVKETITWAKKQEKTLDDIVKHLDHLGLFVEDDEENPNKYIMYTSAEDNNAISVTVDSENKKVTVTYHGYNDDTVELSFAKFAKVINLDTETKLAINYGE